MADLEHELAAGGGYGRLRASNADRERVIDTLKAAYVYGLVTKDEFDARVSQTFAARTYGELAVITADVPAGLPAAPPPLKPAAARAGAPVATNLTAGDRAIMASATVAVLALAASLFASAAGLPIAGLLVLGAAGSTVVTVLKFRSQTRSQRAKRPRGQLPQQGVGPASIAAQRAISAASAERFQRGGKLGRRSGPAVGARS
jgi:hypothetical protein